MESYRGSHSGLELRSRSIPQLALQGTRGRLTFAQGGRTENGVWPLAQGDVGVRAALVVHTALQPLKDTDEWSDGYLIRTHISLGAGGAPVNLRSLCPLTVDRIADGATDSSARFVFRNGWQSWSGTGAFAHTEIDRDLPAHFLRLLTTNPANRAPGQHGQFVSEMFTVLKAEGGRGVILVGFVESAGHFGHIHVSYDQGEPRLECQIELDNHILESGRLSQMPTLLVAFGRDENELVEAYCAMLGNRMNARVPARHLSGWCSWYYYFTNVSENDVLANLDVVAGNRDRYPIDVFQIDDGYQPVMGDWLETNEKFPNGMPFLADRIREKGLIPGIWLAPFLVAPTSKLYREHPGWVLRDSNGRPVLGCFNPGWRPRFNYALDPTHPEVQGYLRHVFQTVTRAWGFSYVKIDFLYAAALNAVRHDAHFTRAGALRLGLEAIREGCGDDTFILGCGCPLGPAVGLVDAMRIGTDVAPFWNNWLSRTLGYRFNMVGTENAIRNTLTRSFMHRRLWLNDPDCVMLRSEGTKLTEDETRALASAVCVLGGMTIISDDLSALDPDRADFFPRLISIMHDQPTGPASGGMTARTAGLLTHIFPRVVYREGLKHNYLALINPEPAPLELTADLGTLFGKTTHWPAKVTEFWTGEEVPLNGSKLEVLVPPHGGELFVLDK